MPRGYASLVRIDTPATSAYVAQRGKYAFSLVRGGGAVAVTIPEYVQGFRGWRYRWWEREAEVAFPNWQDPNALAPGVIRPARSAPAKTPAKRPARPRQSSTEAAEVTLWDMPVSGLWRHS